MERFGGGFASRNIIRGDLPLDERLTNVSFPAFGKYFGVDRTCIVLPCRYIFVPFRGAGVVQPCGMAD